MDTDFGWALAKMRDGYQVRLKGWTPDQWLSLNETHDTFTARDADGRVDTIGTFSADTLLSYDWELAE